MNTIIVHNRWALGDTVCLSAVIRDIALNYPGQYRMMVSGNYSSFWANNPHVTALDTKVKHQLWKPNYQAGIVASGRGSKKHFLSWFHEDFKKVFHVSVPVLFPKGDIHLSAAEKRSPLGDLRYWLVNAGGKMDMTTKVWLTSRYQAAVDKLAGLGIVCVQVGADFTRHFHPRLTNCIDMIGKTDSIRDLFSLVANAEGSICGITGLMHIAGAFDKPCVVIAGGREEASWEGYTNSFPEAFGPKAAKVEVEHRFLHTIGLLDCGIGNLAKGCWRDRTVPIEKSDQAPANARRLCKLPIRMPEQTVPKCLEMIQVDNVVEAVMSYYENGELPPIGKPKGTYSDAAMPLVVPVSPSNYPLVDDKGKVVGYSGDAFKYAVPAEIPSSSPAQQHDLSILDHPDIGGKFTVFVLLWGDHYDLARRCIDSIISNVTPGRLDIRVGANQVCAKTFEYLMGFDQSVISAIYADTGDPNSPTSRKKYPCMREMFWDASNPITTKYVLWFDDDSHVISGRWLVELGQCIVDNHRHGNRLYGTKFTHDLTPYIREGFAPQKWFKAADWWRNKPLRLRSNSNHAAANGTVMEFVTGGFWALATETIRLANIPDTRLLHNGGDICLGSHVDQAGFKIKDFCRGKTPVKWSDAKRRGYHEQFPWAKIV